MKIVYIAVGILAWVLTQAWEWYKERGWWETEVLRRARAERRPLSNAARRQDAHLRTRQWGVW